MDYSITEQAIFSRLGDEKIIELASIHDKQFDYETGRIEQAKASLAETLAFQNLVTEYRNVVGFNQQENLELRKTSMLLSFMLDTEEEAMKRKLQMARIQEAFDKLSAPEIYAIQEYTIEYDLDDVKIEIYIYHENTTLISDQEIIAEARSRMIADIEDNFPVNFPPLEEGQTEESRNAGIYPDQNFHISNRRVNTVLPDPIIPSRKPV